MADYNALRAQTLGSTQEEEAVTVNTRALIDKVLARYSSENTTLRELLQNAADANANSVEVCFQTASSLPNTTNQTGDIKELVKSKVCRMLVKNDGHAFREEDWQRLKRIAEGNPDETKIGAFGVGFYSVFADCEEPFVSSGSEAMAFYWKGNSLFTRRAKLQTHDMFTTFLLEYREPSELPDLKELCKFFATSLTFVKLNSISLYLDDHRLAVMNKKQSPAMPLTIPNTVHTTTADKLMKITSVDTERVQLDAQFMNITHYKPPTAEIGAGLRSIFSRFAVSQTPATMSKDINETNLTEYTSATIFIRIATASVTTSIGQAFARELERATKKPPPKNTKLAVLTMSKEELEASEQNAEIFSNVLPNKSGKIFIGFPTHQTTSFHAHISAHSVIPTVERENIDLNAKVVKQWNIEMLRVAAILARIMYVDEMTQIGKRAAGLKPKDLEDIYPHAVHVMQQFTFSPSTPSASVGRYIEIEFWSCSRKPAIEILSTKGLMMTDKVRLASDIDFLEGLPMLPQALVDGAPVFVKHLKEGQWLTEITISDIRNELSEKALSGQQLSSFLRWLAKKRLAGDLDYTGVRSLLDVAVATTSTTSADGKAVEAAIPISLGTISAYVNPQKLGNDIPLPPECIPFNVTKNLPKVELDALGWKELDVVFWLQYICSQVSLPVEQNIQLSPQFAQHVLAILSKNFESLPQDRKDAVVNALKDKTCIPTKQGMKLPRESYFNTVKLFTDLPLVPSMHGVRDKLLAALGVRKTVELRIVFERLMSDTNSPDAVKWSHVDLIKYLTSVRDDIPKEDIAKLQNTAICKAESSADPAKLFKVFELYEPNDALRKLKLPILQWPVTWRLGSPEAKFMERLGLRKIPDEMELVKLAAGEDKDLREKALSYFVANFEINGYAKYHIGGINIPFLPLEGNKSKLVRPAECYSNPKASIMGFQVLRRDLQIHAPKFGVCPDPDMKECVDKLILSPPSGTRAAREQFGYFASRLAEVFAQHVERLSQAAIVPIVSQKENRNIPAAEKALMALGNEPKVKHIAPRVCYLSGGTTSSQFAEIFDFVDFGQEANTFLLKCGSKHEPTITEIAYITVREPGRLYLTFQSESKYLSVLRNIAENWSMLRKDKQLVKEMKKSSFLAAYREVITQGDEGEKGDLLVEVDEVQGIRELILARPEEVLLIDDFVNFILFKGEVLAAPQEDILENFYRSLGAQNLSSKVTLDWNVGKVIASPEKIGKLQKLVVERTRLFLHNNNEEVKHDARWIENNLKVDMVDSILLKRTLRNEGSKSLSHQQNRTAAVLRDNVNGNMILYVTAKYQYYDIAQALVGLLLARPKPHSSLLLDSLLSTDLLTLKSRGYNVDRILRAKAAEARLAEEQRLRRVEEQRKALEEQEKSYQEFKQQQQQQQIAAKSRVENEKHTMPGSFQESPPPQPTKRFSAILQNQPKGSLLGRLSRTLGLDKDSQQVNQVKKFLEPEKQPEPIKKGKEVETTTEPHRVQANLQRAVQASRSHDSQQVFTPPTTYEVKEEKSYCDSRPAQDIVFLAETPLGMKVFITRSVADKAEFLKTHAVVLNSFSALLKDLAEVFELALTALHVYYDEMGNTIAFNINGALFCNLRFFLQLHADAVGRGQRAVAVVYWFVVLSHELAHNLVGDHSAEHSFYTETFIQQYFLAAMVKVQGIGQSHGLVQSGEGAVVKSGRTPKTP